MSENQRFHSASEALSELVRLVPDFPEPGVLFEDLTPVLADPDGFKILVDDLAAATQSLGCDIVGGLDARGFLLGSAVAYKLNQGILAIRKKGKLPPPVHTREYSLEYGTAALEIPASGIDIKGKRVVLVDDVLATGGTLRAASELLEESGAIVAGYVVVLEVPGLGGREKLAGHPVIVLNQAGS